MCEQKKLASWIDVPFYSMIICKLMLIAKADFKKIDLNNRGLFYVYTASCKHGELGEYSRCG